MKPLFIFGVMLFALISYSQSDITQLEYFIDEDLGVGLNSLVDIEPNQEIDEAITVNIGNDLGVGYHKLYVRTKSAGGNWSHTVRKNLTVVEPFTETSIIKGEYIIDTDYSFTTGTSFEIDPDSDDITDEFIAQIPDNLEVGYHKLFGRVQDNLGRWSQTFRKNLTIAEPFENIQIIAIEYFFDEDLTYGATNVMNVEDAAEDGSWIFNVDYPEGEYDFDDVLYVRSLDSNGNWSHTTILDLIEELGMKQNLNDKFVVYPNPVKNILHINTESPEIQKITIYDITGKNVMMFTTPHSSYNIASLKSGIYILNIHAEGGEASFRIIKN